MRTLIVGASTLLLATMGDLQGQTPGEVVTAFHAALARGDSGGAIALLAPKVVIFEGGAAEMSRDEFAAHHLRADMQFAAATRRTVTYTQAETEGDLAVVISRTTAAGLFRERQINSEGTETAILRRTSEGWRIVHFHWSSKRAA